MELANVLAVSGMQGLYKLVTTRSNGLIIEDFDSGKKTFISVRKHQFTPLESIGIYTYSDVVDIKDIFSKMHAYGHAIPENNAHANEMHTFFREILPDYDEDRVYLSDIKKIIKWYGFLNDRNLIIKETVADEEE